MNLKVISTLILLSTSSLPTYAAIDATLTYKTPTGIALPTEVIQVWGTLSLSSSSDTFTYDPDISSPYGIDASIFPTTGHNYDLEIFEAPFASINDSSLYVARYCSGNFGNGCSDGEYTVEQGISTWFQIEQPFTMTAGESRDFLLAEFTPTDGSAAPGDYIFYTAELGINIIGLDADNNEITSEVAFIACSSGDESCAFTRTVSAVPIPTAAWLFTSGLLGLLGFSRNKQNRSA
jgi:hypothetical protein